MVRWERLAFPQVTALPRKPLGPNAPLLVSISFDTGTGLPMKYCTALARSPKGLAFLLATLLCLASPTLAADDTDADAPKGAAVTVLKAAKSCFSDIVEVSGIVLAREETAVRPERPGLKVTEIMADAGDTVTAGQPLARLALPEGGVVTVQAPVAGLVETSSAVIGAEARRCSRSSREANPIWSDWCRRRISPSLPSISQRGSGSSAPVRSRARCAGWRRPLSPTASSARS
jgi:hypothetical protein